MWRPLTSDDLATAFTPSENAALQAASNSLTGLGAKLTQIIREFIGGMQAAGYPVLNDDTVPDQLRRHIEAQAVWSWLRGFPMLKIFKTDERKQAAADAQRIYEKIVARNYGAIESPFGTDITTGNWNSDPKIIMRTMPLPLPAQQFLSTPLTPLYANPNALRDSVPTNSPGIPQPPINFEATPGDVSIRLDWDPAANAQSYNIYRGSSPGAEGPLPIVAGLTGFNFTDFNVVVGQTYYYKITSVNGILQSLPALEISCQVPSTAFFILEANRGSNVQNGDPTIAPAQWNSIFHVGSIQPPTAEDYQLTIQSSGFLPAPNQNTWNTVLYWTYPPSIVNNPTTGGVVFDADVGVQGLWLQRSSVALNMPNPSANVYAVTSIGPPNDPNWQTIYMLPSGGANPMPTTFTDTAVPSPFFAYRLIVQLQEFFG